MIRSWLRGMALLALGAMSCAQSQPVTGASVRPSSPAGDVKPAPQTPAAKSSARRKALPPKIEISEPTTKLQVGNDTYVFAKRAHEIRGEKGLQDSTTEWWELRDPAGKVIARENGGPPKLSDMGGFEETHDITAGTFHADGGDGILIEGLELPSAPNSGTWVQLFARPWGSTQQPLKSFGPPISADGEFTGIAVDHRRDAPKPSRPGATVIPLHDVMQFKIWTGNFDIEYAALINWITGRIEPAMRCLRTTAKGQVERCDYAIHVDAQRDSKELTFVRLFTEPEEGFGTPEHVVIKPDSKIEYLTAEVPVTWQADPKNVFISAQPNDGEMWLKIRIDGKEGWIHTQEDFQAVGLPQSG
jgi:hypothetical protein